MRKVLLITNIFFIMTSSICQTSFDHLHFEHINSEQGIENSYNHFILKDEDDFVWLSSTEGIYRFDGYEVDFFSPNQNNSSGLLGKNVQGRFIADNNRNIWFSTSQGINRYNLDTKEFTSLQLKDKKGNLIENDYCLFHIEKDSILWVRADWKYLISYNINSKNQKIHTETKGARFIVDTSYDGSVNVIYACPWISGSGFELIEIEQGEFKRKIHYLRNGLSDIPEKSIEILGGIIQNSDTVWLFSNRGLLSFEPNNNGTITRYSLPENYENIIRDGALYKDKLLFLAGQESGLWVFDINKSSFARHFTQSQKKGKGLSSRSLGEVYIDDQNHLWLAGLKSPKIDQCWLENNQFHSPLKNTIIRQAVVNSMVEDAEGRIWCSTNDSGIMVFDLNGELINTFEYYPKENPDFKPVKKLCTDRSGNIWALSDKNVYRFDHQKKKWSIVYRSSGMKLFSFDHLSENSMIISSNQGVFKLRIDEDKEALRIEHPIISTDTSQVFYFYSDERGYYFFPDGDNDLIIFRNLDGDLDFVHKLKIPSEIYSVFWDEKSSKMWFATLNGLYELDESNWAFKAHFSQANPLYDTKIYHVIGDNNGKLWLTTNKGLWSYNPDKVESFQFREDDGLPTDEFTLFAKMKATDGSIWLGTNEGLLYFQPDEIKPYPYHSKTYIKSLKINNTPANINERLIENRLLRLKHPENSIELELIGISNYRNELNQIHYYLDGYDHKETIIKNGETISYKKLPAGNYSLQYYSRNANGLKGKLKEIDIKVLPPFYQNPYFMIPLFLLMSLGAYLALRSYYRRKIERELSRQKQVFEALQSERSRIASEMHDDLGGGLYTIRALSHKIRDIIPDHKIPETLTKIENKATDLVENMREIIWAMDSQHDSLPQLIAHIREQFVSFFEDSEINCKAQIPGEYSEDIIISGKKRRNISLCVKELAHNVVKHSQATEVELGYLYTPDQFKIWVKDNGVGIDLQKISHDSHGIRNMEQRMDEIGGSIQFQNTGGTLVSIEIPLT